MPRKKYSSFSASQELERISNSYLSGSPRLHSDNDRRIFDLEPIDDLHTRVQMLIGVVNDNVRKAGNMLFFVMYDIESNKVRTQISKYLLREGCLRIQNSIFLANLPAESMEKIRSDLAAVQESYDNNDSILVVPISTDYLQSMKIIGKDINMSLIMRNRNVLFF